MLDPDQELFGRAFGCERLTPFAVRWVAVPGPPPVRPTFLDMRHDGPVTKRPETSATALRRRGGSENVGPRRAPAGRSRGSSSDTPSPRVHRRSQRVGGHLTGQVVPRTKLLDHGALHRSKRSRGEAPV